MYRASVSTPQFPTKLWKLLQVHLKNTYIRVKGCTSRNLLPEPSASTAAGGQLEERAESSVRISIDPPMITLADGQKSRS